MQELVIEIDHLTKLVQVDSGQTARLLLLNFRKFLKPIVFSLRQDQKLQYKLLTGIFTVRDVLDEDEEVVIPPELHELYVNCTLYQRSPLSK